MRSKKILLLNWRDKKNSLAGGAEYFAHEISTQIISNGGEVIFFTCRERKTLSFEIIDGIKIYRKGNFITVYFWAFFYYVLYFRKKIDTIIDCHNGIPFFTPLYSRKKIILVVHHVHQYFFLKENKNIFVGVIGFLLESILMRDVYKNTPVIAVSPSTKADLIEKIGFISTNIIVAYNGINSSFAKDLHKIKKEGRLIIYLGRLKKHKHIDHLISATELLVKNMVTVKVIIVGTGDEEENLKKMVKEKKLEKVITFTGYVSEERKWYFLKKAHIIVNPSSYEGWGISIVEAAYANTPAITSNVPGLRDVVEDGVTGALYKFGDVKDLSSKIQHIIENNNVWELLSQNAQKKSLRYTWQSTYESIKSLL